jgi:sn-glycerol 3-phosphate transport system substrate-binding protein
MRSRYAIPILVVLLAACGKPAPIESTATQITYWRTLTGAAGNAQDQLVERFNASQTDVAVSAEFQGGYADLATKLMTAAAGGGGPNVSQLGTFEIREFAEAGLLVDLRPYMESANGIDTQDWPGTMLAAGEIDGGLYWLPFNVTVPVLYYNKEAFEEAGLPGPPATWSEFYEYVRALTKRDENGYTTQMGLSLWDITWPILSAIWSEGGELASKDYNSITLDHPVAIKVLTEFQRLSLDGLLHIPDRASGGHRADFTSGRAAMILDSPAPFHDIFAQASGFTPAVANYPAGASGKVYAPGGGGIVMWARAPEAQRDAAWALMRYLLQPEQIAFYAKESGYAAFTGAAREAAEELLMDPRHATIHEAVPYLRGDFTLNMSPVLREAFDTAFQRIMYEDRNVAAVLRAADLQAEAILAAKIR